MVGRLRPFTIFCFERGRRLPAARGLGNGKIVQIVQIVHFDTFCAECVVLCGLMHFVRNVSFRAV